MEQKCSYVGDEFEEQARRVDVGVIPLSTVQPRTGTTPGKESIA